MKFKVTATIPVELEIDCQSKEEALNTATTILQEQRDDGDYASIVADCIESALVSGSITMTAVDNHEALVNELRTKRKISIQDMDAFLGYEIDKNDDMMFDDDYINANLHVFEFSTKPERSRTFIVVFPRGHIVFVVLLFKRLFIHCIADENLHTAIRCDRNHIHLIKHVRQDVIDIFHITDNVIPCPTPQTNILVVGIRDIDVHLLVVAR